jgi:hypothetical protein
VNALQESISHEDEVCAIHARVKLLTQEVKKDKTVMFKRTTGVLNKMVKWLQKNKLILRYADLILGN